MNRFHKIIALTGLTLALAAVGCGDDASCENVVDHTIKLLPKEMSKGFGKEERAAALKKCEKESTPEQRECAMKAKDFADLMKCSK